MGGDFHTPPAFSFPPSITVRVQDNLTLDQTHTFATCTTSGGRVRCSDRVGNSLFRANFKPFKSTPSVFTFRITFKDIAIDGPFQAPVKLTITHNAGVVRMGTISDCRATASGLICHTP